MAKTLRVILTFVILVLSLRVQGKSTEHTAKDVRSSTVFDIVLIKHNQDKQRIVGTGGTNRVMEKTEDLEERNRTKRFISWPRSPTRGLIIQRKKETKNVWICHVFLAYILKDKCNLMRLRLK